MPRGDAALPQVAVGPRVGGMVAPAGLILGRPPLRRRREGRNPPVRRIDDQRRARQRVARPVAPLRAVVAGAALPRRRVERREPPPLAFRRFLLGQELAIAGVRRPLGGGCRWSGPRRPADPGGPTASAPGSSPRRSPGRQPVLPVRWSTPPPTPRHRYSACSTSHKPVARGLAAFDRDASCL